MVDTDTDALLAAAAAQPHDPGFVPFARRREAAGIPVEVVSRRVRLLHRAGARRARRRRHAGGHRPDHVRGRRRRIDYPERPPDLPRLRDLQAPARARAPGRGPGGRVHRRRRERPLCRRLQPTWSSPSGRWCRSAWRTAGPFQRWTEFAEIDAWLDGDARRLAARSGLACPARGRGRSSAARRSGATASRTRRRATGRRPPEAPTERALSICHPGR